MIFDILGDMVRSGMIQWKVDRERLEDVLKRNEELEKEVKKLNERLLNIMTTICVDLSCQVRKRDFKLFNADGTSNRQKVEETKLYDK